MTDAAASTERALAARVARCLGRQLTGWRRAVGGYTAAARLIVTFADGGSAFVKAATNANTASWLRAEHSVYAHVRAAFLPSMLAWEDDGAMPFIVLEDLSRGDWSASWTAARVERVLETLRAVAATPPPPDDGRLEERWPRDSGWKRVARVQALQRAQLEVALPWAIEALGLRALDGTASR